MPAKIPQKPFWMLLTGLIYRITGNSLESIIWETGKLPMSTFKSTAIALTIYYVTVFGGQEAMRYRPPFELNALFQIHNLSLTVTSGILLALFLEQLIPTIIEKGVYDSVCTKEGGWTKELVALYYLNYLTKYLEFIDTCFLVLRKKPLTFLHTYHHGATALLCYVQLTGSTPVSWVPIVLNLAVHCLMYWYYFQSSIGNKIWWKKYITLFQITQFVIDLGFVYYTSYNAVTDRHFPSIPHHGRCEGSDIAAATGVAILTSYLFLFIAFYLATYKQTPNMNLKTRIKGKKAEFELSRNEVYAISTESKDDIRISLDKIVRRVNEEMMGSRKDVPALVKGE